MSQSMTADLARSGLTPEDLGAKEAGSPELAAIKVPSSTKGYVIPYYQPNGERLPFYRVKLFDQDIKYKQVAGTPNHVYYPKNFKTALEKHITECKKLNKQAFIILTEGEKKAAACCRQGIPCVALGGVDSWRNRTLVMPAETKLEGGQTEKSLLRAKLPSGDLSLKEDVTLATGLSTLVDNLVNLKLPIVIIYDTDEPDGLKLEVQRAAATLAHQLIHMGVPIKNVKQVILPYKGKKIGLDDYLLEYKPMDLVDLCQKAINERKAFPRHPNPRALINGRLQAGQLTRKEVQEVALTVLAELDARGRRLISKSTEMPYYFDEVSLRLMPAKLIQKQNEPLHESPFGRFLYQEYGLSSSDARVFSWLAAQFTGEEPIEDVNPYRIMTIHPEHEDEIAVQISDSHFAVISGDPKKPLRFFTNGSYGILFEQGQVLKMDPAELAAEFDKQLAAEPECWWHKIFTDSVNLVGDDTVAQMVSLLYYISPWLLRWRGTQLPAELLIGEAGSGKSSLYELRLSILTGEPFLRNIPTDLRDWFASIVNVGGLHVIDNVQFTNKELRQRLSDEMCRIITEPKPHIEMRRLYTTTGQQRIPVNTVFAMTAIQQPFYNSDIIQRAAIYELSAVGTGHQSNWVETQLERFGGRLTWLTHHLVFLHRFLRKVKEGGWNENFKAHHRLANYEQCLSIAGSIFGFSIDHLGEQLAAATDENIINADQILSALREYHTMLRRANPGKEIKTEVQQFTNWCSYQEVYASNMAMQNITGVDKVIKNGRTKLCQVLGIRLIETKDKHSNIKYIVLPENSA